MVRDYRPYTQTVSDDRNVRVWDRAMETKPILAEYTEDCNVGHFCTGVDEFCTSSVVTIVFVSTRFTNVGGGCSIRIWAWAWVLARLGLGPYILSFLLSVV